jgi:hypothetical protein
MISEKERRNFSDEERTRTVLRIQCTLPRFVFVPVSRFEVVVGGPRLTKLQASGPEMDAVPQDQARDLVGLLVYADGWPVIWPAKVSLQLSTLDTRAGEPD